MNSWTIVAILLLISVIYVSISIQSANSTGIPRSIGFPSIPPFLTQHPSALSITVPISWCAVGGSPATNNPSIPSVFPGGNPPATSTDIVLRDRHLRATINFWLNQAGMVFQTTIPIHSFSSTGVIPILPGNPNVLIAPGEGGREPLADIVNPNVNSEDIDRVIHNCRDAWDHLGFGGTGITVVNVDRFLDRSRFPDNTVSFGGCYFVFPRSIFSGACHDNIVVAIDNQYTFPGVTPRGFWFSTGFNNDPLDIALGSALGFAMGANHFDLLCTSPAFGPTDLLSGQGTVLDPCEVQRSRFTAEHVSGAILDPQNKTITSDIVEGYTLDKIVENKTIPNYLDLSQVNVRLNTTGNIVTIGQQIFGLIPDELKGNQQPLQYWTFIDTDNNSTTGASQKLLQSIGSPSTNFNGADLVVQAVVNGPQNITGSVWQLQGTKFVQLPSESLQFADERLIMFPVHASSTTIANVNQPQLNQKPTGFSEGVPIHDIISVTINHKIANIGLDKPLKIQAITATKFVKEKNNIPIDKIDDTIKEQGVTLVLKSNSTAAVGEELKPSVVNTAK
jgi:hypothetical protein